MIYFISDLHLGHSNIFKYEPIRKELFNNHKTFIKAVIDNWNSVVKPDDIVYNLGDFIVGFNQLKRDTGYSGNEREFAETIMNSLNGEKHLVLGNHDHKSVGWYKSVGFKTVENISFVEYNNKKILLFHYPLCDEYLKKESKLKEVRSQIENKVDLIIHGHVHLNRWCQNCTIPHFNASVENIGFKPISIDNIIKNV
jgi:calcineurin-like phosphoesterase family protein